jgi:hypothetical protein
MSDELAEHSNAGEGRRRTSAAAPVVYSALLTMAVFGTLFLLFEWEGPAVAKQESAMAKVKRVEESLADQLKREPTDAEIASSSGLNEGRVRSLRARYERSNRPMVVLLPIEDKPAYKWQRELLAWLDILDPAIMSLPSQQRGFSTSLRSGFVRPVVPLQQPDIVEPLQDELPPRSVTVREPTPHLAVESLEEWLSQPPPLAPSEVVKPKTFEDRVYWTSASGDLVSWIPEPSLAGLKPPLKVIGPTVLQVTWGGGRTRIQLNRSCGQKSLDNLAVLSLQRFMVGLEPEVPEPVLRRMEADGEVIHADWRYAPGVTQTPVDHKQPV